jgi:hypothetical protein
MWVFGVLFWEVALGCFYGETVKLFEGTQKTVDYGPKWAFGQVRRGRVLGVCAGVGRVQEGLWI